MLLLIQRCKNGSKLAFLRLPRLQVDSGKALIAKARAEAEQARKHRAELQESCSNVLVSLSDS